MTARLIIMRRFHVVLQLFFDVGGVIATYLATILALVHPLVDL